MLQACAAQPRAVRAAPSAGGPRALHVSGSALRRSAVQTSLQAHTAGRACPCDCLRRRPPTAAALPASPQPLRSAGCRRRQLLVLPHAAEGSTTISLAELEEAVNGKNGNGHGADAAAAADVASAVASDAGAAAALAPANDAWQGTWTKAWYAVAPAASIDGSRPTAFTLLGKSLVLWRDGDGRWACVEDRCPHRAAPLSEGKVWEDGTLMCSCEWGRGAGSWARSGG